MSELQNPNSQSVKDRIAARRAKAAADGSAASETDNFGPVAAASSSGSPSPARVDRFSRYRASEPLPADAYETPPSAPAPHAPAARPDPAAAPSPSAVSAREHAPSSSTALSRAERFRSRMATANTEQPSGSGPTDDADLHPMDDLNPQSASQPHQMLQAERFQDAAPEPWVDPNRPAGSAYSEEEWAAAEAANPGCVVFEMVKLEERALMSMPRDAYDEVFSRSLVIHEKANCPYRYQATISIEHHGEFGVFCYGVIRSSKARERSSWVDGSKLVIKDLKHCPPEPPPDQRPHRSNRAQRYR